jgi:hypothetical protein
MDARTDAGTGVRSELTQLLRDTRTWLLIVGALLCAIDVLGMYLMPAERDRSSQLAVLAGFAALWWCARYRPAACCSLALAGYWVSHLSLSSPPSLMLLPGLAIKVGITIGMCKCIAEARRAERTLREIALPAATLARAR